MKPLAGGMTSMLSSRVETLAFGMRVQRRDGQVTGWTSADRQVTLPDVLGAPLTLVPTNAIDVSTIARSLGRQVDNLQATVLAFDEVMTHVSLLEGRWDGAEVYLFEYDWATPANGLIRWCRFNIHNTSPKVGCFVLELRDIRQWMMLDATPITQANCHYRFGGPGCGVNLVPHTYTGTVTAVASKLQFTTDLANPDGTFLYGVLTWLTGLSAGVPSFIVTAHASGVMTLERQVVQAIAIGDTFSVIAGCLKTREACKAFGNVLNFPGFDQIPTTQEMVT